ncbi:MAG: shikimate kinase [Chthoniobacterales bacterium]
MERGGAIILIGFMGSGKSCAGVELCRRTGLPVFDTDALIISKVKSSISEIFDRLGEDAFREEETAALRAIPRGRSVIVTGGGCILRAENVELLRELGTIVWLQADEETIFQRVAHREDRPLLRGGDPRGRIRELLAAREALYRGAAEVTIDTAGRTPAEVADAILAEL